MKKVLSVIMLASLVAIAGCAASDGFPSIPAPESMTGSELEGKADSLYNAGMEEYENAEMQKSEEQAAQMVEETVERARMLAEQYYYDEAIALLDTSNFCKNDTVNEMLMELKEKKDLLVNYTGEIPHVFFHSLIVYPEMVFFDRETPMGGYNSGFSEKAELEKILPQLYNRGYVLYDLDCLYDKTDMGMQRREILLPPGKRPLILSVDDVAYAYGNGFAEKLFLDETGRIMYAVPNPDGGKDIIPDGDVMGVVDRFVEEHPDFAYHGHKGTIALTGFQGAFGYYPYTDDGQWEMDDTVVEEMTAVVDALKDDGWNFASHSYTHNGVGAFFCPGCSPEKMQYDTEKWLRNVSQYVGKTRLYIAPFGFRVPEPALREIVQRGFDIYCTVDNKVYNEVNDDYFLMSRIEISGYSMTYYSELLNNHFFNVDEVFDVTGRPPVIE